MRFGTTFFVYFSFKFSLLFAASETQDDGDPNDFYTFVVKDPNGRKFPLEKYRGFVTLVVNVASECGYTNSHYKALIQLKEEMEQLHDKFEILAFPSNQFGEQEPGTDAEVQTKIRTRYPGVNFRIFAKINVTHVDADRAWTCLAYQSRMPPTWNFWKYLVNPKGKVVGAWGPHTTVESLKSLIETEIRKTERQNNEL